jgi:hypothetical protein
MGFRDVVEYHGPAEKGKDIICWRPDDLKTRQYYAVILKTVGIHGSVGKSGSASEVLAQVRQAFCEPYRDVYGLAEVRVHRCLVITSQSISAAALESIGGQLAQMNLDRMLDFLDRPRLETLLHQYFPYACGRIGDIVYTYEPSEGGTLHYFYITPYEKPDLSTRTLVDDSSSMVNIDFNKDGTLHGIEVIMKRFRRSYLPDLQSPEDLIAEFECEDLDDSVDYDEDEIDPRT